MGTPFYLSPEQASGRKVTTQPDLYSLGGMMFEMPAGRRPFMAESLELLLVIHIDAETPALHCVHANLQKILDKLMHMELSGRYASASDLLADQDREPFAVSTTHLRSAAKSAFKQLDKPHFSSIALSLRQGHQRLQAGVVWVWRWHHGGLF